MKLLYSLTIRISLVLAVILTAWAILFYMAIIDEINDEMDDFLEDYSEVIMIRSLSGMELPSADIGSNNQYYLTEVTAAYAHSREEIVYKDSMVYIAEKGETEPARILTTIFKDKSGRYHELIVSTPTIEKYDLKEAILGWITFLYTVLLLTMILINVWVFYRSMKPLYVLLKWLDKYTFGQQNVPLKNETNVTEFRQLNEAALRNARRGEQQFEQQKQFIGNASHEIQTPLAICRNRLEMLMEDESLSEFQLEELAKTHQTLERITKLNSSLLLLSKIDNGQFTDAKELDFNGLLKQYLEDYKEVYGYKEIKVILEEKGMLRITMNAALAATLLTNLLKNAFVHNINEGHIHIEFTDTCMVFRNSGVERALDNEHIFERFYHESKTEGSNGLGLAIVSSICKLQHLDLRYYFENNEHCFEISKSFQN